MVTTTGGPRAMSVPHKTNARDTLKRRDKPYKLEQEKVVSKKRKLVLYTTYDQKAPQGYTFLAVGSNELAELCKELSRKRSLPVNVVNDKPASTKQMNPSKVSHHVHRIGWHFRSDVVEEACEQLGYVPYEDRFITLADLQQQKYDSITERILAKHGMRYDNKFARESETQVRAAIKELFPKIPQEDLDNIVSYAWAKGSKRVGEATNITLARRVQLAVIARIRHKYTDYDALLRSKIYEWQETRAEVEPTTLKKLIEWRGEHGDDDDELEEIVRETIVLDDDEDDGDAPISVASGSDHSSDVEIVHPTAANASVRAERAEDPDRNVRRHQQPQKRTMSERNDIARKKIKAARGQMAYHPTQEGLRPAMHPEPQPVYAPSHGGPPPPQQVMVNGTWMQRVHASAAAPQPYAGPEPRDRPMQSIERDDDMGRPTPPQHYYGPREPTAAYHPRPATPPNVRMVDLTLDSPRYPPLSNRAPHPQDYRNQPVARGFYHGETVDLTSPRRGYVEQPPAQPEVIRVVSGADGRYYAPAPPAHYGNPPPPERVPYRVHAEERSVRGRYSEPTAPEYDPNRPLLDDRVAFRTAAPSRYASPAQLDRRPLGHASPYRAQQAEQPQVMYHEPAFHSDRREHANPIRLAHARTVPAPVHGAPAPVQQMPREAVYPYRVQARTAHNTPVQQHAALNGPQPWYNGSPLSREHNPR
ncbi:hypothetical protein Q7P37_001233 [Cladosporium fusiforme]